MTAKTRCIASLVATAFLSGCASPEALREDAVMDRIEHDLILPKGAHPLGAYARYYAPSGNDLISAEYVVPDESESGPDDRCEEMTENFTSRPVPCPPMPRPSLRAGFRQWQHSVQDFPLISDGGCDVITISYSMRQEKLTRITCNGFG